MSHGYLANERAQKTLEAAERQSTEAEAADLASVMSSAAGRRFVHRLIHKIADIKGPIFNPSIKEGECHGQHMAYLAGCHALGLFLESEADAHCPVLLDKMNQEHRADKKADDEAREKAKQQSAGDHEHDS